ncbi:MAG: isoprenyl transferase [Clostridia bacterium]|nr:isoprenyl transferase [Clostridia bacterium]
MGIFKKKLNVADMKLPNHIGVIMDGNGRWAQKRGLPRMAGHKYGAEAFKRIVIYANKIGVKNMTVYAFSTENKGRPKDEIDNLMALLVKYLMDEEGFISENIRVKFVGRLTELPQETIDLIHSVEDKMKDRTGMQLYIALYYGGRDEIVHAARRIAEKAKSGEISPEDIDEAEFSRHLFAPDMPDADFIIRPSGEYRLSNFLTWQSAYSEFWFSDVLWPDFSEKDLDRAIADFSRRDRRFGKVK